MEETGKRKRVMEKGSENEVAIVIYTDSSKGETSEIEPSSGTKTCDSGGDFCASSSLRLNSKKLPPLLEKLWDMMENKKITSIVSWSSTGTSIVIPDTNLFAANVLPLYFTHNNLQSFVCQLNSYGFKKLSWARWEYGNEYFRKGEPHLLEKIRRRVPLSKTSQPASSRSGPSSVQISVRGMGPFEQTSSISNKVKEKEILMEHNLLKQEVENLKENQGVLEQEIARLKNEALCHVEKNQEILKLASTWIAIMQNRERSNSGLPNPIDKEETPSESINQEEKTGDDESAAVQPKSEEKTNVDVVSCSAAHGINAGTSASSMETTQDFTPEVWFQLEKMMADEEEMQKNYTGVSLEDLFGDSPEWSEYVKQTGEQVRQLMKSSTQDCSEVKTTYPHAKSAIY